MDDDLLLFYNKELNYLRRSAAAFARQNPSAAAKLRISEDAVEDPHVERLIQAVAFLNGRTRKKLDDDYPELTEGLLNVLFPHYLNPIPSMTITRMFADKGIIDEYHIAKGTLLETAPIDDERLLFRTAYPVSLWPFDLRRIEMIEGAYKAPPVPSHLSAVAIIRMEISCFQKDLAFANLRPNQLRFFLRGDNATVAPLYHLLMNNVVAIAIADDAYDTKPAFVPPEQLVPVGFAEEENLLDYPPQSFSGYRLLSEYFAFPQKYHFIELQNLRDRWQDRKNKIEIYFYFDKTIAELSRAVNKDTFVFGCTPAVNLFPQTAEPIVVNARSEEYHVIADSRHPLHKEIYQIRSVKAVTTDGKELPLRPFYGISHDAFDDEDAIYWYASRRSSLEIDEDHLDNGSELYLNLVDKNYLAVETKQQWILYIDTVCMNRDLPKRLPYGGGQPKLRLREGGMVSDIECLVPPSATVRTLNRPGYQWKLISHLSLNHMPFLQSLEGVSALRELLSLYEFGGNKANQAAINAIDDIQYRQIASRVSNKQYSALCRGIEITLTLDEARFKDQNLHLFSTVLDRFFALYAPMNSFTKLIIKAKQKDQIIKKWKPRSSYLQLE